MKARLPKGMGGGPQNMQAMIRQAQKMQEDMEKLQAELDEKEHEVSAGGGAVKVKIRGNRELVSLELSEDVVDPDDIETLQDLIIAAVNEAIKQLIDFRKQEGAALQKKFEEKINNIAQLLRDIEPYEKVRVEKIKQRITDGLNAIPNVEYDKNRLEQELIYYIEKLDISEEKQRLANHLNYFVETMNEGHGQGKKLGFIAQEMGREINTTGSKSNQAEMQNIVVKMKDELEQIKEQVLNAL